MNPQLEQQIRQIVQSELNQSKTTGQFTVTKIPNHTHNGIDSPRVNEKNLSLGVKYLKDFLITTSGPFIVKGISNFKSFQFIGVVFGGGTQEGIVNGSAMFGTCYEEKIATGTTQTKKTFVQACNSILIDTSSIANTTTTVSAVYFVDVFNSSNVEVATAQVTNWDSQSITIDVNLVASWEIAGVLLIS